MIRHSSNSTTRKNPTSATATPWDTGMDPVSSVEPHQPPRPATSWWYRSSSGEEDMLLLGTKSITIDGIQVFPDHADPNQFWYLPGPVSLARDPQTREARLLLLEYRPAAVTAGAHGGGFLMFTVNLE